MPRFYRAPRASSILQGLRRQQRVQGSASILARSGLSVTAEGVTTVDGDFVVEGNFTAEGKVSNAALTEPVVPGVVNLYAENFSLGAAFVERVGVNLTVPADCTRLLASMSAWLSAYNPNTTGGSDGTGSDFLYVYCRIGSTSGKYNPTGISGNGGTASASGGFGQLLSGLTPGDTVRVAAWCSAQYTTIPADAYNYVSVTGTLNWLR